MNKHFQAKCATILVSKKQVRATLDLHYENFKTVFPVGEEVTYIKHGFKPQTAVVQRHCCEDELFVESPTTGRLIKISLYHILQSYFTSIIEDKS